MRHLIKQREIIRDDWRYAEEDPLGRERALILPLARWKEERERWWLWDGRLGVRIGPTDQVSELEQDFTRIALVAVLCLLVFAALYFWLLYLVTD